MTNNIQKNYEKELNAIKALLPKLKGMIEELRAASEFRVDQKAKNDLVTPPTLL